MLAARITFPHLSVSSAISFSKPAGGPASTVTAKLREPGLHLGIGKAALISWLSLSTIAAGVFLGAPMPHQLLAS